jgi:branched-chain amino acid transport system ATP-binding protein
LIREFREHGSTVLIVEHTLRVVDSVCDRVLVLDQGRKVVEGTPAELKADPRVRQAYYLL